VRIGEYQPQKALLVDRPPAGDRWIHELKLDGFRMGVFVDRGNVRIISRRGTDYTTEFPEIVAAAKRLKTKSALIDGEIVVLDKSGVSRFQLLQQLGNSRAGLAYFAFDLLSLEGESLTKQPLEERKAALRKLIGKGAGVIRYTDHMEGDGDKVFDRACALGAEGIISKLRDGPYRLGARSSDWQKIKCIKRQEFVVGGFTDPSGSRAGVGSILVGYYERNHLRFAGKVGTGAGWSNAFSLGLRRDLEKIEIERGPFDPPPPGWLGRNAHWVKPVKVAEVEFTEWTGDGHIRHPSLQGFRSDKSPREVHREREEHLATSKREREEHVPAPKSPAVYPRIGVTRRDLVELYSEIADWVLPHIEQRPLTLVRETAPITRTDALRTQAKFIHHTARDQRFVPDTVPRTSITEQKKIGEYCYIDSRAALLALIESGVIELHTWNARVDNVEQPDRVVFDIDPGDEVAWRDVVAAARRLRAILKRRNLESWVKTTGGKGLHVVVPFRAEHDWDSVFEFTRQIATAMTELSKKYTLSFDKSARRGRILIDYKRNYRTSIAVAAFSTRAVPSGSMSVPVAWEELARIKGSDAWTVENIRERLRRLKEDPWRAYWKSRQRLQP
jgi:bifunctional non-homologous end joining protein LigD